MHSPPRLGWKVDTAWQGADFSPAIVIARLGSPPVRTVRPASTSVSLHSTPGRSHVMEEAVGTRPLTEILARPQHLVQWCRCQATPTPSLTRSGPRPGWRSVLSGPAGGW